ncbi:class II fumarate hydratase [Myxococcota bacterium]|nr:class II fumarate hydratase [Myxococcota bacterium]MCZ7619615.1 class II fumarate hydratase [Myxococcota bacterium]
MPEQSAGTRIERDSLGEIEVPADALWGASTQRAVQNFPISGERFPRRFVAALGLVKGAAAATNAALGVVETRIAAAIEQAAREVAEGRWDAHFVVDVFQTGSGTSTNMNANEVIATRARQILGAALASVHPNDHVNASQSSNDVIPSTLHIAARCAIHEDLLPALGRLHDTLRAQAHATDDVVKIGRTHLMDATPIRLGQEFGGWARQLELSIERVATASGGLAELALGGTAVGTGLNSPPGFAARAIEWISVATGLAFREATDHFEAQSARDAAVALSASLRGVAVALFKIASDLRLLASGPRCGFAELRLPALQPGSSIMPGKVNPVLCESVIQVAAQVVGNDAAVALGGMTGQLELNAMIPLIARNVLESIRLLTTSSDLFAARCVHGIEADRERATALVEQSLAMVTVLAPRIGYERAAELAQQAAATGRTIRALCLEQQLLPRAELEALLDARAQTGPGAGGA